MFDKTEEFYKRQKLDPTLSSNPSISQRPIHPILESGMNRFQFKSDNTITIYKRPFDDLLFQKATNLNRQNYRGLFIHGARGIGKSYSLYNLVLNLLQSNSNKIVYISDCSVWVNSSSPIDYLVDALLVAFYDLKQFIELPAFEYDQFTFIDFLTTQIVPLIRNKQLNLFFVFDQYNLIPEDQKKMFPFSLPFCITEYIADIFIQKQISFVLCSSNNNNNRNKWWEKFNSWVTLALFEQFTDDQIKEWISFRHLTVSDTQLDQIIFLTNRIPLEINDFLNSMEVSPSFEDAVTDFTKMKKDKYI